MSNNNLEQNPTFNGNSIQQTQVGTLISNNPSKFQESVSQDESEQNNSILSHKFKISKPKPQRHTFSNSENFERLLRSLPGMNKNISDIKSQNSFKNDFNNNNNNDYLQQFNTNSTYNNEFNTNQTDNIIHISDLQKFESVGEQTPQQKQNIQNYTSHYINNNEISLCVNYEQNKIFDFEAKRKRFLFLKKWEEKKKTQLIIYQDIISALGNFILLMSKEATQTQNQLINYYRDRARQDIQYIKGQTIKLKQIYKQDTVSTEASNITVISQDNNQIKKQITYPQIADICQQLDNQQLHKSGIISDFANQVEQKIVKDKLLNNFKDYDKKMKNFLQKYKNEKQQSIDLNKECEEKFKQFIKVFGEQTKANRKKRKNSKDLLYYEMDYTYLTFKYYEVLKGLAEDTINFLIQLKQMEKQRLVQVQQSVEIYTKLYNSIYKSYQEQNSQENNEIFDLEPQNLQTSVKDELKINFSMENLLNDKQIQYINDFIAKLQQKIKIDFNKSKDYQELIYFIQYFQLMEIPNSPMILKELRALKLEDKNIDKKDKKSILISKDLSSKYMQDGEWIDVDIIHTSDNFLLITEGIFEDHKKPIISLPVNNCICKGLETETDDEIIQIIHIKNRLIYKSKKYYTFQMTYFDKQKIQEILYNNSNLSNSLTTKPKSFLSEPNQFNHNNNSNIQQNSFMSKP